jgi:hypothetical protein
MTHALVIGTCGSTPQSAPPAGIPHSIQFAKGNNMSVMDDSNCCSKCFQETSLYSLHALISAYPIFDQVIGSDFEEEAGKLYCETCYLAKFDGLFSLLQEKGLWFTVVKMIQQDKLLINYVMACQYACCPLCGIEWDDDTATLTCNNKTEKIFRYIYRKNGIQDLPLLKMICMKCASKIEVEILKKKKLSPLSISMTLFTDAGKSYLEKCLKEGV